MGIAHASLDIAAGVAVSITGGIFLAENTDVFRLCIALRGGDIWYIGVVNCPV